MSARFSLVLFAVLFASSALADSDDALAPAAVEAVQERSYKMALELNLGVGTAPIDPFTKSYYPTVGAVIHFSDSIAWQVVRAGFCSLGTPGGSTIFSLNVNSQLRDQLERDFSASPKSFDEIRYFFGSDLIFAPLYGKTSFLNRFVLNYEAYVILGVSLYKFATKSTIPLVPDAPGLNVGGGFRLFHTQHLSYRVEVADTIGTTFKGAYNVLTVQVLVGFNFGGASE